MATTTQATTDDSIWEDVLSELKWDPRISSENDIAVAVKDKVVTLSGFVPTFWDRDAAERAAKRVYGVKAVANDISVKPLWQRTDPEIARDAIQQLERHISIPYNKIKVSVNNGWVTLEGTVDRELQKKLAHSAVKKLKGVTGITNNITTKPKITPGQVKDKIEDALRRSAELDARRIRVEVKDGTVTLHGRVRSWAEREEAERAAWSSPGTTVVENEIVVEP
jgi:osmotically-inducible protein OsmY